MIGTSLKNVVSSFASEGSHFEEKDWLKCLPIDLLSKQGKCEFSLFGHVRENDDKQC